MSLNVSVRIRITPSDIDVDFDSIIDKLSRVTEKYGKLHSFEVKPIAFGLKCLEAALLLDDSKGGIDEIEEKLKKFKLISQIDILEVNRL